MSSTAAPLLILVMLALGITNPCDAQVFQNGDLFVSENVSSSIPTASSASVDWYRSGVLVRKIAVYGFDNALGLGLDSTRRLYVGRLNDIQRFDVSGNSLGSFGPTLGFAGARSITLDRIGNVYIAAEFFANRLLKLDGNGATLRTFDIAPTPANPLVGLDLASDQCTARFTISLTPRVWQYDICGDRAMADLATLPSSAVGGLRILPDGSTIVASGSVVVRISGAGQVARTYSVPAVTSFGAIAVDVGAQAAWVSSEKGIYRIDLSTGAITNGPILTSGLPADLAVFGEPRAAVPPSAIPTISLLGAFAILVALVAIAWTRL